MSSVLKEVIMGWLLPFGAGALGTLIVGLWLWNRAENRKLDEKLKSHGRGRAKTDR